jgi:signal transduction histidine kinase
MSALLAAALAWLAGRPLSRFVVAPLTRLRERIAELDIDAISHTDIGPSEGVLEVDALRSTIGQMILRVDRALGLAQRFAANAAHELRTPLTSIRGELELLSESIADVTPRANASRAEQKLAELSLLVERLLILSVPARSRTDAHEVVSLRDLLEDSIGALPGDDRERVAVSDEDALIRGDSVLLATMIANGVANGLKFGSRVSTRLAVVDGEAVIHIDDDGPGISDTERERAFEPFFRSQDALRRRVPGHGLGLALIRHIAQTHGGNASLVDKAERGARLEIRLPVADRG